ncbi:MAG: hypothetical protein ACPLRN_04145 [Microgenomates group bacterium]
MSERLIQKQLEFRKIEFRKKTKPDNNHNQQPNSPKPPSKPPHIIPLQKKYPPLKPHRQPERRPPRRK